MRRRRWVRPGTRGRAALKQGRREEGRRESRGGKSEPWRRGAAHRRMSDSYSALSVIYQIANYHVAYEILHEEPVAGSFPGGARILGGHFAVRRARRVLSVRESPIRQVMACPVCEQGQGLLLAARGRLAHCTGASGAREYGPLARTSPTIVRRQADGRPSGRKPAKACGYPHRAGGGGWTRPSGW